MQNHPSKIVSASAEQGYVNTLFRLGSNFSGRFACCSTPQVPVSCTILQPHFKLRVDESNSSQLPIFYRFLLSAGFSFKNQRSNARMIIQLSHNFLPAQHFQRR
jgi:hypothetical protein